MFLYVNVLIEKDQQLKDQPKLKDQLLGDFNAFEKYAHQIMSNWIIFPGTGVKIEKIFETTT